jgi:DUF1680 family protein
MKKTLSFQLMPAVLVGVSMMCLTAETIRAEGANMAVVATPSSSYASGDTSVDALNDGNTPRRSRDRSDGSWGNWNRTGTQWAQYDWSKLISTNKIDVYWWDDRQGVRLPEACRLLYWDGNKFVPVKNSQGLGVEGDQFNTTTFDEVTTDKLRLEIDSDGEYSTGILEWKVYDSGKSPAFPPSVNAGVDRVVILGGKTYLNGAVKGLSEDNSDTHVKWSKKSGPGKVTFADAGAASTTAMFSALGDYVLELTGYKGPLSASSTLNVQVSPAPPAKHLDLIDTSHYKITSPLWKDRTKALMVSWIPHCIERISDPDLREGGINNFVEAAKKLRGEPAERHRGYVFSNAWVYNIIESMCVALVIDPQGDDEIIEAQKLMRKTLDEWIPRILAAQEPDGYIQTAFTLNGWEHWSPRHRGDHEGYVAGYFLEAAVAHYMLTDGKDARLYNAAKKLADCWVNNIGPEPGKKEWYDGHQEMELALVRFGRFVDDIEGEGKGSKYIKLAKFLLDCRKDGSEYDQSHLPVIQQYEAVGHAVRASYTYAGMADVAMETGDTDYRSAIMSIWDNIVNRKYYVTGGVGSGETSEGYGPDYSLRNNAYCESCSSCGEIFFQHKLNLMYNDAKFADLYEETLYNALLGSIALDGKTFYYQNPLTSGRPRYPWHGCPCCVGNIPRVLLMLPTWTYVKSDDGIYVNLFVGSEVTIENVAGTNVKMVQDTNYPWSGNVTLVVNPEVSREFTIAIRVPNRDISALYSNTPSVDGITSIAVNGNTVKADIKNGYAMIKRKWKAGDKIELVLPMKPMRVKADERIEADRGRVALRYGPLIYNIESIDQDINKVLGPDSPLTTKWKPDLLNGVMVIKGKFTDGTEMTAIPNYARNNRVEEDSSDGRFGGPGAAGSGDQERERRRRGGSSIVWIRDTDINVSP